jgi:putative tryptophan/tyrosine transport system substrate-binding protein
MPWLWFEWWLAVIAIFAPPDALADLGIVPTRRLALPTWESIKLAVRRGQGVAAFSRLVADLFRRAAELVDKILRGTNPADIPVEQPTKFDLVINLKTAKVHGIDVPPALLARADEVIE